MRWLDFIMSWYVLLPWTLVLLFWPPSWLALWNRFDLILATLVVWFGFWTTRAVRGWKGYTPLDKGRYFKRLILFGSVVGFFFLAWALSGVLGQQRYSTDRLGILGNNAKGYELHTLDLYPYSGFHPRANCRVKGPMPLEANPVYQKFDVRTGDHGFFIDFDLDDPPAKEENEFRIVLIGGSTAQGFGGQTNKHMFYRVLEDKLQAHFAESSLRVRVINLALMNSQTYQNFITLNKWGHALQPDLILSFSGMNDAVQPLMMGVSDMPYRFQGVLGLTRSTWVTENPGILEDASKYFPALKTSLFGVSVRALNSPEAGNTALREYCQSHQYANFPSPPDYVVKLYVHALKSIKRDFQGIPMMIAFQPYHQVRPDLVEVYNHLVENAPRQLKGYINDKWYFRNVQDYFQERNLLNEQHMCQGLHLLNTGHEAAAEFLCQELLPIVREMRQTAPPGKKSPSGQGGDR